MRNIFQKNYSNILIQDNNAVLRSRDSQWTQSGPDS